MTWIRTRTVWLVLTVMMVCSLSPVLAQANEAGPAQFDFQQNDLDGDGIPDVVTFESDLFSDRVRVSVYDQGNDSAWGSGWQDTTDFVNDIWIYEKANSPGPRLVLRFTHEDDLYRAELWDDVDGNRRVSLDISAEGRVEIDEAAFPSAVITAEAPFVSPEGRVNPAVKIEVFRRVVSTVRVEVPFDEEGRPQSEYVVYDFDGDGAIDGTRWRGFPNIPLDWLFERTGLSYFPNDFPFSGFEDYAFFPLLGDLREYPFSRNQMYRNLADTHPPILFDWEEAVLRGVTPFVPLWGGNRINFNSFSWLEPGEDNLLAFERFGHYLYTDSRIPNLIIRYSLGQNDYAPATRVNDQLMYTHQIEMTWNRAENAGTLMQDYKLELAGLHSAPTTVLEFPDFGIYEYPYEQWPTLFTEMPWAFATFVATEGTGYETNEAIHEWNAVEGVVTDVARSTGVSGASVEQVRYLFGETDTPPDDHYKEIRPGFRGEYANLMYTRPELYMSSIDRKLHLRTASYGVWNLSPKYEIRYASHDGDVITSWSLVDKLTGRIVRELIAAGGLIVLNDEQGTRLRRIDSDTVMFTTLPPRSRAEWESQNAQFAQYELTSEAQDFEAMFAQFGTPEFAATSARITDFRLTEDGAVFTLQATNSTSLVTDQVGLATNWRADETLYHVRSTAGTFVVQPLTPPVLEITGSSLGSTLFEELRPEAAWVTIRNSGLQDIREADVALVEDSPWGERIIDSKRIALNGQEETRVELIFTPQSAGTYPIRIDVSTVQPWRYRRGGALQSSTFVDVETQPLTENSWRNMLSLTGELPQQGVFIPALLGVVMLCAAILVTVILRSSMNDR
ncbi:MAG: hypothetical protein IPM16_01785 [Chloroflexi bacterium]|nr:hypothetical protein [Chloroflexota bacterium]